MLVYGGIMRLRLIAFVLLCGLAIPAMADDTTEPVSNLATNTVFTLFQRGDGMLSLSAGTSLGIGFFDSELNFQKSNLKPAVAIGLSYSMFMNSQWAMGGELNGYFFTTALDRNFFIAPIAARLTRAFDLSPFMITPNLGLGMAISSVDELRHVDPFLSLGSGFAWRYNDDVSYGLNLRLDFIPQFYIDTPSANRSLWLFGAVLNATYHL